MTEMHHRSLQVRLTNVIIYKGCGCYRYLAVVRRTFLFVGLAVAALFYTWNAPLLFTRKRDCDPQHGGCSVSESRVQLYFMDRLPGFRNSRPEPKPEDMIGSMEWEMAFIGGLNCSRIFEGNVSEIARAKERLHDPNITAPEINDKDYIQLTKDCATFIKTRGYDVNFTPNLNFSLAYTILLHDNVYQFERLLRSLYNTRNQYCIHLDAKATRVTEEATYGIIRCFPNVFVATRREFIVYAGMSRLMADINCMSDLLERNAEWRFLINYASSEFPLRNNKEIIEILQLVNGTNEIHMTRKFSWNTRYNFRHAAFYNVSTHDMSISNTNNKHSAPPLGLNITKGNAYNVFSREFVVYALNSYEAKRLLEWSADTFSPDEHFWSTLNNLGDNKNLSTPGGYKGPLKRKPYFTRYIQWRNKGICDGKYVRGVCIIGVGDLSRVWNSYHIAVNKFDLTFDPIAYTCMEELLRNPSVARKPLTPGTYRRLYTRANLIEK